MKKLTQITKEIRAQLKKEFPKCKFSVTTQHGLEINIALMNAPESPLANGITYAQLNHYYIDFDERRGHWMSNGEALTEAGAKMLKRVVEIGQAENWDKSDIQSDYFNVNYYFGLAVGKWDRPFVVK